MADIDAKELAGRCSRARTDFWSHDRMDALFAAEAFILSQAETIAALTKEREQHQSEREYIVGWNDGFEHATSETLKFPTMLRKMWSGGEVQKWLDDQFALARAAKEGQ